MSGACPALVIDTRPVWESGIAGSESQPFKHPSVSYFSAPLQTLRGLPQDALLGQWFSLRSSNPNGSGSLALVATSPASVEALQALPLLSKEISQATAGAFKLFAVGAGSASVLAGWGRSYGQHSPVISPQQGSGVEAFLLMLQTKSDLAVEKANTLFVLLESTTNQPDLALGLNAQGFQTARFGLYERNDRSFELPSSAIASALVCLVVSSSALVHKAVNGLASQGLSPQQAHWFCHHSKIAEAMKNAGLPFVHQLANLNSEAIIEKVIQLSSMND